MKSVKVSNGSVTRESSILLTCQQLLLFNGELELSVVKLNKSNINSLYGQVMNQTLGSIPQLLDDFFTDLGITVFV